MPHASPALESFSLAHRAAGTPRKTHTARSRWRRGRGVVSSGCAVPPLGMGIQGSLAFPLARGPCRTTLVTPSGVSGFSALLLSPLAFAFRSGGWPRSLPPNFSCLGHGFSPASRGAPFPFTRLLNSQPSGPCPLVDTLFTGRGSLLLGLPWWCSWCLFLTLRSLFCLGSWGFLSRHLTPAFTFHCPNRGLTDSAATASGQG